jgi:uncharacterized protein (UPF0332 family)
MKEVQDFIAKAERFLKSAEQLFEMGDYDSCASRSYYAMYFMAEAALMLKGLSASSHQGVIALFGKHFVQTGVFEPALGRALRRAYDLRLAGDYAVGISVTREGAEDLLKDTRRFIAEVRAHLEREGKEA